MPLYEFAIRDGVDRPSSVTVDMPNDRAARIEGGRLMSEMLHDEPLTACDGSELSVVVTDGSGIVLCSIQTTRST